MDRPLIQRVSVIIVLLALAVAAAISPHSAHAVEASDEDLRKAEALATEGKVYFRSKLFSKSADKFMQAFGLSKRPALVYNAARAYEEAGQFSEAMAMFEHYRTIKGVDAKGKVAAAEKVKSIRVRIVEKAKKAKKAAAEAAASEPNKLTSGGKTDSGRRKKPTKTNNPGKSASGKTKSGSAKSSSTTPRRLARRKFPLWRAVGSGTALMFAGAAYINAYKVATTIVPADVINDKLRQDYRDNQSTAQAWQIVAITSAAVGLGVGAWAVWEWMDPQLRERTTWQLAPTLSGRGLQIQGAF